MKVTNAVILERIEHVRGDVGEINSHLKEINGAVAEHSTAIVRVGTRQDIQSKFLTAFAGGFISVFIGLLLWILTK